MRGRAYRRHQRERIKQRVQRYYGGYARGSTRHVGRLAETRTPCSCWMCGNPRRYWRERTLQERRARQEGRVEPGRRGG
jgi:hypothetical protein